ncbi:MAG: hypothetical protein HGB36_11850 [Chlorobiaceae bacterium]|nr:hypothetical protein [Chlorobiaceae bacterium]
MNNKDNKEFGFRFHGFKIVKFSYEQQDDVDNGEDFEFQVGISLGFAKTDAEDIEQINIKVSALIERKSINKEVANIEAISVFQTKEFSKIPENNNCLKYPKPFIITLVSLAISTTRGAILAKGGGSFLELMPMPLIDPKEIVENFQQPN